MAPCIRSRLIQRRGDSRLAEEKNISKALTETPQFSASALTEYPASWASCGQLLMRCKGEFNSRVCEFKRKGAESRREAQSVLFLGVSPRSSASLR